MLLQGYINMIVQERNWVTVEGLNCKYEMQGGGKNFPGRRKLKVLYCFINFLLDISSFS